MDQFFSSFRNIMRTPSPPPPSKKTRQRGGAAGPGTSRPPLSKQLPEQLLKRLREHQPNIQPDAQYTEDTTPSHISIFPRRPRQELVGSSNMASSSYQRSADSRRSRSRQRFLFTECDAESYRTTSENIYTDMYLRARRGEHPRGEEECSPSSSSSVLSRPSRASSSRSITSSVSSLSPPPTSASPIMTSIQDEAKEQDYSYKPRTSRHEPLRSSSSRARVSFRRHSTPYLHVREMDHPSVPTTISRSVSTPSLTDCPPPMSTPKPTAASRSKRQRRMSRSRTSRQRALGTDELQISFSDDKSSRRSSASSFVASYPSASSDSLCPPPPMSAPATFGVQAEEQWVGMSRRPLPEVDRARAPVSPVASHSRHRSAASLRASELVHRPEPQQRPRHDLRERQQPYVRSDNATMSRSL
ncbi:hypothetical protein PQX77_001835 [Marasmius sp. AFHP31]|nr:hypothetical protein PQX77_001835 [Marasmius sp. AFHP31]